MADVASGIPFWLGDREDAYLETTWDREELALAEWGLDAAEIPFLDLDHLIVSWQRRKRFEAQLQAVEIGKLLFGAKGDGKPAMKEVSPEEMYRSLGMM